jgi:hypothetical protein
VLGNFLAGHRFVAWDTGRMKAEIVVTVAFDVIWVLYVTCLAHIADLGSVALPR